MLSVHTRATVLEIAASQSSGSPAPTALPQHIALAQARLAPEPVPVDRLGSLSADTARERCLVQHTRQLKPDVFQCTAW
jgi:hypothetical protein